MLLLAVAMKPAEAQLRVAPALASFVDLEGNIGLTRRTPLGVAPDQSVVLVDSKRDGLYKLSADLSNLRRVGRKGSGPGEYLRITSFGWRADTLWVSDNGNARITYVDAFGRGRVRSQPFLVGVTSDAFTTEPLALTPDGAAICGLLTNAGRGGATLPYTEPMLRFPLAATARWDTLMLLDVRHRRHRYQVGKLYLSGEELMSDATLWALSRNGKFAAKVDRSDDALRRQEPPLLTLLHTDGRVLHRAQLPNPRERVTRSDVNKLVAEAVAAFNSEVRPDWIPDLSTAAYETGMFVPFYRISAVDIVLGDDGTILLRGNDWNGNGVNYTWFNPQGTIRGTFTLPVKQIVRAVSGNSIWSIAEVRDGEVRLIKQNVY